MSPLKPEAELVPKGTQYPEPPTSAFTEMPELYDASFEIYQQIDGKLTDEQRGLWFALIPKLHFIKFKSPGDHYLGKMTRQHKCWFSFILWRMMFGWETVKETPAFDAIEDEWEAEDYETDVLPIGWPLTSHELAVALQSRKVQLASGGALPMIPPIPMLGDALPRAPSTVSSRVLAQIQAFLDPAESTGRIAEKRKRDAQDNHEQARPGRETTIEALPEGHSRDKTRKAGELAIEDCSIASPIDATRIEPETAEAKEPPAKYRKYDNLNFNKREIAIERREIAIERREMAIERRELAIKNFETAIKRQETAIKNPEDGMGRVQQTLQMLTSKFDTLQSGILLIASAVADVRDAVNVYNHIASDKRETENEDEDVESEEVDEEREEVDEESKELDVESEEVDEEREEVDEESKELDEESKELDVESEELDEDWRVWVRWGSAKRGISLRG